MISMPISGILVPFLSVFFFFFFLSFCTQIILILEEALLKSKIRNKIVSSF